MGDLLQSSIGYFVSYMKFCPIDETKPEKSVTIIIRECEKQTKSGTNIRCRDLSEVFGGDGKSGRNTYA
jgi:hypothetical protein